MNNQRKSFLESWKVYKEFSDNINNMTQVEWLQNESAGSYERKFAWLPKKCHSSKKILWLVPYVKSTILKADSMIITDTELLCTVTFKYITKMWPDDMDWIREGDAELVFCIKPRNCHHTSKVLWMSKAYKVTLKDYDFYGTTLERWYAPEEYLMRKLAV